MNSHLALTRHCRGTAAMAVLLLAWMVGPSAIAEAQVGTAPGARAAASVAPAAASAPPSAQDIREIRGPKPFASPWLIPLAALSALLVGGGAWAGWVWFRRPKLLLQTPVEIALARLEYARGLMRPDLGREFSIEASSIVREYIESRFRVMAAHLTTHEFLSDTLSSTDPLLAAHRPLLAEFMESCDLAKFGGWNLSPQAMEEMLRSARTFVVESAAAASAATATPIAAATPAGAATPTAAKSPSVTPREAYDSLRSA
jgi:hypothetical protein